MKNDGRVLLGEMHHAFDTAYASARKYTNKTFTLFGAELTMLLFYMSSDEINYLREIFINRLTGWCMFVIIASLAFFVSAVLFIIVLAIDQKWSFPPDEKIMFHKDRYKSMSEEEIVEMLIEEYKKDMDLCVKKVRRMKILTDTGMYALAIGVLCLLLIKVFVV